MHLSFLTSHNLLFFSLCKFSKKTTFSVFLSFFLVKLSKSRSLKLNISRTAWPILMILISFCRILNGRSDEINLFWRCSSPLRTAGENGLNSVDELLRNLFHSKIDNLGKCSTLFDRHHARWTASLDFKIDRIPHGTIDLKVELFTE